MSSSTSTPPTPKFWASQEVNSGGSRNVSTQRRPLTAPAPMPMLAAKTRNMGLNQFHHEPTRRDHSGVLSNTIISRAATAKQTAKPASHAFRKGCGRQGRWQDKLHPRLRRRLGDDGASGGGDVSKQRRLGSSQSKLSSSCPAF